VNTFGINRPVYSFGLGLVLTLIDPGFPTEPTEVITFYPTDNRSFIVGTKGADCILDLFCEIKDPQEKLYYNFNYTAILETTEPADAIISSAWSIHNDDGSLVIDDSGHDGLIANVHMSGGGKLGSLWRLINHIVTSDGREYERTLYITIQNK
jgi:hypothetical protein